MRKKMRRISVLALVLAMLLNMTFVNAQTKDDSEMTVEQFIARYGDTLDMSGKLKNLENDEAFNTQTENRISELAAAYNADGEPVEASDPNEAYFTENHGTKLMLANDDVEGIYLKEYTLRAIGDKVEIWVANDLSFQDDRATHVVTQEQVNYLRDTFDATIYPTDTSFFGTPESLTGADAPLASMLGLPSDYYMSEDGNDKIMMLVDNVRDDNYYDSEYPFYVAGFFWQKYEDYMNRNIITIDSAAWETRLEETYQGTVAHEFQHLIHADNDPAEETFLNEGMSDFAEYLCFGTHPMGHVNFFLDHPENSLVTWDEFAGYGTGPETLADYGQAYLLELYFLEQFGHNFVKELATNGEYQGIESINKTLEAFNTGLDFNEVFRRFSIAVAIDDAKAVAIDQDIDQGIYSFDSIDLAINYESAKAYDKDGVPAWGADYKVIDNFDAIKSVKFDGYDFQPSPWVTVADPTGADNTVLWGNEGDQKSNQIMLAADLTALDTATLNFDNLILIEEQWDYGFVEISTDNGQTWTTLGNDNTQNAIVDEGYPAIKEKLADGYGFTGYYDNWTNESFDLTPYVGQNVLIKFNYMTDWGYNDPGWFIDNISIPEIGYMNTCDDVTTLINPNEFYNVPVEYGVTFINEKEVGKKGKILRRLINVDPINLSETDTATLNNFFNTGTTYIVVWYAAPVGETDSVDFTYEIITKDNHKK